MDCVYTTAATAEKNMLPPPAPSQPLFLFRCLHTDRRTGSVVALHVFVYLRIDLSIRRTMHPVSVVEERYCFYDNDYTPLLCFYRRKEEKRKGRGKKKEKELQYPASSSKKVEEREEE